MKKNLEYYLSLPYSYTIIWSDEDNCYLGSIIELEKNMTCGKTRKECESNLDDALRAYIETSLANNMKIAEPARVKDYKGNITYRTNGEKHYRVAQASRLKGISINTFIDEAVDEKLRETA